MNNRKSEPPPASFTLRVLVALSLTGGACSCFGQEAAADALTQPTAQGQHIHWREHRIDDELLNGGTPIRGGDGLAVGDFDGDGHSDIVSVHEDSNHLRIAFGSASPHVWRNVTIAQGQPVKGVEDVAVGDLNGDGWPDLVVACEDAHLAYFQNPGPGARSVPWPSLIPSLSKNRGSWIQTAIADLNGDGVPEVLGANKGQSDLVAPEGIPRRGRSTSAFYVSGDPLDDAAWTEQQLLSGGVPNQVIAIDIDADGDNDVLAALRKQHEMYIIENTGTSRDNKHMTMAIHRIELRPGFEVATPWAGRSQAFNAEFADMDGDGRLDLVVNVVEFGASPHWQHAGLGWLKQPARLDQPWTFQRIGHTLPDWIIGLGVADVDGDGDTDAIAGGYSGLNILKGTYSGDARSVDDPRVTASSSVARIAWFENPGEPGAVWQRHDISRRIRGMFDQFIPVDLDADGDVDWLGTRGNSGEFDGVFWLEQLRSATPHVVFTPARQNESRQLPLPPSDWRDHYTRTTTTVAPSNSNPQETRKAGDN